jgi:hypothetical protein
MTTPIKTEVEMQKDEIAALKASIDENIKLENKYNLPKRFTKWKREHINRKLSFDDFDDLKKVFAEVKQMRADLEKDLAKVK